MKYIIGFIWLIGWIAGIVLAKGFWSTCIATITAGLWSFYLIIELTLKYYNII